MDPTTPSVWTLESELVMATKKELKCGTAWERRRSRQGSLSSAAAKAQGN